jgi:hypothetical protein
MFFCSIPQSQDPEVVFDMLKRNFDRSYVEGLTRAPFGLYVHAAWFFGQEFRSVHFHFQLTYLTSKSLSTDSFSKD